MNIPWRIRLRGVGSYCSFFTESLRCAGLRLRVSVALLAVACSLIGLSTDALSAESSDGLRDIQLSQYYEPSTIEYPANSPGAPLPLDLDQIPGGAAIAAMLGLDDNACAALERNGFVVVPRGRQTDFLEAYRELRHRGIPLFVTSDTLLHFYHVQFDDILMHIETNEFLPDLAALTRALLAQAKTQREAFEGDLEEAAARNIAYLGVALELLGDSSQAPVDIQDKIQAELDLIQAHAGFSPSPIFIYHEDYSQYVPRGHYTRSEELGRFFRAMMWYGRMAFLLKGNPNWGPVGEALVSVEDARIQTLQALLIALGLDALRADDRSIAEIWNRIYAVTAFFVGLADDLTPYAYKQAVREAAQWPAAPEALADPGTLHAVKTELALMQGPEIYGGTGWIWVDPPVTPETLDGVLDKTKGMRLMGQRFIPDSYMFQELVFPEASYYTGSGDPMPFTFVPSKRGFPRGLDVMAVMGSERALLILDRDGDTDYLHYDEQMNELIRQFRAFSEVDWNRNLYWSWLYTLRALLETPGPGHPGFMRTDAWLDKQLNSALASWTQLRHDTILYAKQSYTPGETSIPPEPDTAYAEPVPQFYHRLLGLASLTRAGLMDLGVLDSTQEARLAALQTVLLRLEAISIGQLAGSPMSLADRNYLLGIDAALEPLLEGIDDERGFRSALVADVHTDINTSAVLEEGVGYVEIIVAAFPEANGAMRLAAGPVFSQYEFKHPMANRLTDEAWFEMLEKDEAPDPPAWTRSFRHPVVLPPLDLDRDGLPDDWERAVWGSTTACDDPAGDPDQDGQPNRAECLAGTDPRRLDSCLRVTAIRPSPSEVVLEWNANGPQRYRVFTSSDLQNWYLLGVPAAGGDGQAQIADTSADAAATRFYRVQVLPQPGSPAGGR
ncbi:MAG TPA: DUF3160 domain-containing protein [Candidatus Paceibacterota bacterium]|nr:DUF3160 domain-containing protein [Verrucomicrobiota bacterium]HRZ47507.1 DUF3160 domain-containing protein [Candidatus Paceibacterota bacterium]HRZ92836.1 DUF3160 domain-containing protein [Candidatus Paceibacterota bacterium]